MPSTVPNELLYGRAGYLWACSFLNKHLGKDTIPSNKMVSILSSKRKKKSTSGSSSIIDCLFCFLKLLNFLVLTFQCLLLYPYNHAISKMDGNPTSNAVQWVNLASHLSPASIPQISSRIKISIDSCLELMHARKRKICIILSAVINFHISFSRKMTVGPRRYNHAVTLP